MARFSVARARVGQTQATDRAAAALDGLMQARSNPSGPVQELGDGPFIVNATAWVVRGVVG